MRVRSPSVLRIRRCLHNQLARVARHRGTNDAARVGCNRERRLSGRRRHYPFRSALVGRLRVLCPQPIAACRSDPSKQPRRGKRAKQLRRDEAGYPGRRDSREGVGKPPCDVTAGFAKLVLEVNQYAAVMYAATVSGTTAARFCPRRGSRRKPERHDELAEELCRSGSALPRIGSAHRSGCGIRPRTT